MKALKTPRHKHRYMTPARKIGMWVLAWAVCLGGTVAAGGDPLGMIIAWSIGGALFALLLMDTFSVTPKTA